MQPMDITMKLNEYLSKDKFVTAVDFCERSVYGSYIRKYKVSIPLISSIVKIGILCCLYSIPLGVRIFQVYKHACSLSILEILWRKVQLFDLPYWECGEF